MSKLLVTGGCGFIGSHTIVDLLQAGHEIVNIDNLSNSSIDVLEKIRSITGKELHHYTIDLTDLSAVKEVFLHHADIEGVIHFAALKSVGDSVHQALHYFRNNIDSLLHILQCAVDFNVKHIVFSSSCTVYGNADQLPVTEESPMKVAESPYGRTKQIGEYILEDSAKAHALKTISLRYFNPAGAHPSAKMGEAPSNKAQNLVPVITETAIGKREKMIVFGDDYSTTDGYCVRDYIHIMDLAAAHTAAIQFLLDGKQDEPYDIYNIGVGRGTSVLEAIKSFEKISGLRLNYEVGPRREGDVIEIYADNKKISERLDWNAQYDLDDIMKTAWEWEQKRTNG